MGIIKIDAHAEAVLFQFWPSRRSIRRIIELVQKNRQIKLSGQDKLRQT